MITRLVIKTGTNLIPFGCDVCGDLIALHEWVEVTDGGDVIACDRDDDNLEASDGND